MGLSLKKNILLPIRAQERMERTKYQAATLVPIPPGAVQMDVPIDVQGWDTSILVDNVPSVDLSWITGFAIVPLPPNNDFRSGFRVLFGSAAPVNSTLSYSFRVRP